MCMEATLNHDLPGARDHHLIVSALVCQAEELSLASLLVCISWPDVIVIFAPGPESVLVAKHPLLPYCLVFPKEENISNEFVHDCAQ